jgi:esterase/lipase superfamily enzyme
VENGGESIMSNDFLISLRDFDVTGTGEPRTGMGEKTTYFEMSADQPLYYWQHQTPQEEWLARLRAVGKSVLVFVHGFADDAGKVVERHRSIKPHLPSGFSLVSFDWPAGNQDRPYETDKRNAWLSAPKLMDDCLNILLAKKLFTAENIHLFAHSMGAYVTETAFQLQKSTKISHVLMAAADVDQLNYRDKSAPLTNFLGKCTDLTAYWSTDDKALQDSETTNKYTPLGLEGYPDPDSPGKCYGVQCTTYYNRYAKYPGQDATFSHIWYILYQPTPPSVNDFYTDMNNTLQAPPPRPPSPMPTRAAGFMLRRPT